MKVKYIILLLLKVHHILEGVKGSEKHYRWDNLFEWLLTATGTLNIILHLVVILLALMLLCLLLIIILYVKAWYVTKQMLLVHHVKSLNNVQK